MNVSCAVHVECVAGESPCVNMGLDIEIPLSHFVDAILAFRNGQLATPGAPKCNSWTPLVQFASSSAGADDVLGSYAKAVDSIPGNNADASATRAAAAGTTFANGVTTLPMAEFTPSLPTSEQGPVPKAPDSEELGTCTTDFALSFTANRSMGITLDMQSEHGDTKWVIGKIERNSWAQEVGLELGDRLMAINGNNMDQSFGGKAAIQRAMAQRPVNFNFQRVLTNAQNRAETPPGDVALRGPIPRRRCLSPPVCQLWAPVQECGTTQASNPDIGSRGDAGSSTVLATHKLPEVPKL